MHSLNDGFSPSDIHVIVHIVHLHCDLWSIIFQNSFPHSLHLQKKVYLCSAMIKLFLLLCSLEAEEVATHGAPEAWKEARERVDKTFQVFFHTFVSPAQYILYLIQLNCTKVNDDVNDEYEDIDDYDDIYIMMKCLSVCLSVTKNHHFFWKIFFLNFFF